MIFKAAEIGRTENKIKRAVRYDNADGYDIGPIDIAGKSAELVADGAHSSAFGCCSANACC